MANRDRFINQIFQIRILVTGVEPASEFLDDIHQDKKDGAAITTHQEAVQGTAWGVDFSVGSAPRRRCVVIQATPTALQYFTN
jgi:hypothetical protein